MRFAETSRYSLEVTDEKKRVKTKPVQRGALSNEKYNN